MSYAPTVGPTGGVKNRLDVVDFVKDDKFFTLYILALDHIQKQEQDPDKYTSFFQLGGIHGLPPTDWAKKTQTANPTKKGYCTHGNVLFPTWHRTYLSIYEQAIQKAAIDIAVNFKHDKNAWIQAALDLRQPYWDWGFQLTPPEELFTKTEVEIVSFEGPKVPFPNPLLRYGFNPIHPSFSEVEADDLLKESLITIRHPNQKGEEDIPALIEKFKRREKGIRDDTYGMLTDNHDWRSFSNHSKTEGSSANSLEAVHDKIHGIVGYGIVRGHMGHQLWAGFDPIFWFHHANVDRLLSLWQALNPRIWVSEGKTTENSFSFPNGTQIGVNSPLEPFYKTEDEVWTSAALQDTKKFGYSYPDFDSVVGGDESLIRDAIQDLIDRRYGVKKTKGATNAALDLLSSFQGVTEKHSEDLKMYNWSIHATFKKFELNESFSLLFYFADNDGDYDKKESFVGCIDAFRGTTPETCDNCKDNEDLVQEGFVHLNRTLAEKLGSFDRADVLDFLKNQKLSCKLYTDEATTLSSLKLTVEGRPLHIPPGQNYPVVDKSKNLVIETDLIQFVPLNPAAI